MRRKEEIAEVESCCCCCCCCCCCSCCSCTEAADKDAVAVVSAADAVMDGLLCCNCCCNSCCCCCFNCKQCWAYEMGGSFKSAVRCSTKVCFSKKRCVYQTPKAPVPTQRDPKNSVPAAPIAACCPATVCAAAFRCCCCNGAILLDTVQLGSSFFVVLFRLYSVAIALFSIPITDALNSAVIPVYGSLASFSPTDCHVVACYKRQPSLICSFP
jgi:hypothetical protein